VSRRTELANGSHQTTRVRTRYTGTRRQVPAAALSAPTHPQSSRLTPAAGCRQTALTPFWERRGSYRGSDQPRKQLRQVVSPGDERRVRTVRILLRFGEPTPAAAPLPGPVAAPREASGQRSAEGKAPTAGPSAAHRAVVRQCHRRGPSPGALPPPSSAGVIKQPTTNACVLVREPGSND